MAYHSPQAAENRARYLLLLFLISAGFIANFHAGKLFIGFNYLPGSFFVLLAVRLFGIPWGLAAAVIVSSLTFRLFGHPYAMLWLCGEPIVVGWLLSRSRSRNLILFDALYWPLFGVPLIWLIFRHVMAVSLSGTLTAMLMYWVIGITNALMASLMLTSFPRLVAFVESDAPRSIPIHQLIFNLMMAIVLLPAVIILVVHGKDTEQRMLQEMAERVEISRTTALYEVRLWLQRRSDGTGSSSSGSLEKALLMSPRRPFHIITLVDGSGRTVASTSLRHTPGAVAEFCAGGETNRLPDSDLHQCLPRVTSLLPRWQRVENSSYFLRTRVVDGSSWNLVVETPFAPYQKLLLEEHRRALLVVISLSMLILLTSLYASRRLAAPLRYLSRLTSDLPERLLRESTVWPESSIEEIDQLGKNFRAMASTLGEKFLEIAFANERLELRVDERTEELTRANAELQHEIGERLLTERQRDHLMEELVTQVHFLQTLIDAIPNPLFYKDVDGLYLGCNRAFETAWGHSRQQIVGKTVSQIFPPAAADAFNKADRDVLERRGVQVYESRSRYADGDVRDLIFYKASFDDSSGEAAGLIGTVVDVTQRKKAESERDKLLQELRQKNKEQENIIYVASHDLRSPLVNIQGFSRKLGRCCEEIDTLVRPLDLPVEVRRQLEQIISLTVPKSVGFITSSVEKMDMLLQGLLRLSRLGREALCFETLDMREVLEKIVSSMAFQLEAAGARVEVKSLHPCVADLVQISQVFSNLLDNALKYRSPDRLPVISVDSQLVENGVRYCVEDNGIGIAAEHQERIWDIFHRLDPGQTSGEGLGLTMARRIVDRLGGSLWVESEPGKGSRFYLIMPHPPEGVLVPPPGREMLWNSESKERI